MKNRETATLIFAFTLAFVGGFSHGFYFAKAKIYSGMFEKTAQITEIGEKK